MIKNRSFSHMMQYLTNRVSFIPMFQQLLKNKFRHKKPELGCSFDGNDVIITQHQKTTKGIIIETILHYNGQDNKTPYKTLETALKQLPKQALKGLSIQCLVPSDKCTLKTLKLPKRLQPKDIRLAIAHQLKTDQFHYWDYDPLVIPDHPDNLYIITIIDPHYVDTLTTCFEQANVLIHALIPEPLLFQQLYDHRLIQIPDEHNFVVADMDNQSLKLTLYQDRKPILFRQLKHSFPENSVIDEAKRPRKQFPKHLHTSCSDLAANIITSLQYFEKESKLTVKTCYLFGHLMAFKGYEAPWQSALKRPVMIPELCSDRLTCSSIASIYLSSKAPWSATTSPYYKTVATGIKRPLFKKLQLLPITHRQKKTERLGKVLLSIGIPALVIYITCFTLIYNQRATNAKARLDRVTSRYDNYHKDYLNTKESIEKDRATRDKISTIHDKLIQHFPIGDFLYHLSTINTEELYLKTITISDDKLRLRGNIINQFKSTIFPAYLSDIKRFPHLHSVNYSIEEQKKEILSQFLVQATLMTYTPPAPVVTATIQPASIKPAITPIITTPNTNVPDSMQLSSPLLPNSIVEQTSSTMTKTITSSPVSKPKNDKPQHLSQPPSLPKNTTAQSGTVYRVIVGAFQETRPATQLVKALSKSGISAFIRIDKTQQPRLFKVQSGAFQTKEQADSHVSDLSHKGYEPAIEVF